MTTTATADELDTAILDALHATPDGCAWWAEIRSQLPASTFWPPIKSLVRLVERGQVHTTKIGGRDFICLAITLGPAA
ncbi:hypothetical protein KXD97_22120 [Mycobacterium sp. SMC-8]|uniref:hypothetical protein n=1 Tax=Mycobacterium sp. SMC-8 TaxID=2857060 RepID=UPI0021B23C87|nr:hypothetical protein [Mycobacterium sp. SMC-8]UXA10759.1 hypothetical protein KXD97_22120 [Mycobacterium sp. SMC-8]